MNIRRKSLADWCHKICPSFNLLSHFWMCSLNIYFDFFSSVIEELINLSAFFLLKIKSQKYVLASILKISVSQPTNQTIKTMKHTDLYNIHPKSYNVRKLKHLQCVHYASCLLRKWFVWREVNFFVFGKLKLMDVAKFSNYESLLNHWLMFEHRYSFFWNLIRWLATQFSTPFIVPHLQKKFHELCC